ncbi:apolipoprotein D-like [Pelmatolapia mariae]|uniref:apolipoprotein D-like n=1 Tax=Pelmatolapia mariae TaxID=158779 RepID=UPI002FE5B92E
MNAIQVISLTLLSIVAAGAQSIKPGRCPVPAVQEKFDAARYLGKWHEIQRLSNSFQKGQCSTATYSLQSPGVVGVLNKELLPDGTIDSINGTAKAASSSEPAKLLVTFFENTPPSPYWVLSTDYDNFALVYSCTEMESLHGEFIWILSRNPTLPKETLEELQSILSSFGASVENLLDTNQDRDYCRVMHE